MYVKLTLSLFNWTNNHSLLINYLLCDRALQSSFIQTPIPRFHKKLDENQLNFTFNNIQCVSFITEYG